MARTRRNPPQPKGLERIIVGLSRKDHWPDRDSFSIGKKSSVAKGTVVTLYDRTGYHDHQAIVVASTIVDAHGRDYLLTESLSGLSLELLSEVKDAEVVTPRYIDDKLLSKLKRLGIKPPYGKLTMDDVADLVRWVLTQDHQYKVWNLAAASGLEGWGKLPTGSRKIFSAGTGTVFAVVIPLAAGKFKVKANRDVPAIRKHLARFGKCVSIEKVNTVTKANPSKKAARAAKKRYSPRQRTIWSETPSDVRSGSLAGCNAHVMRLGRSGTEMVALNTVSNPCYGLHFHAKDLAKLMAAQGRACQCNPRKSQVDHVAATELLLYADNTRELYRQKVGIEKNLEKMYKKGTYDAKKAPKAWLHWMDAAAKRYHKEFGGMGRWSDMFNKSTREAAAKEAAENWEAEAALGNFQNPAPRPGTMTAARAVKHVEQLAKRRRAYRKQAGVRRATRAASNPHDKSLGGIAATFRAKRAAIQAKRSAARTAKNFRAAAIAKKKNSPLARSNAEALRELIALYSAEGLSLPERQRVAGLIRQYSAASAKDTEGNPHKVGATTCRRCGEHTATFGDGGKTYHDVHTDDIGLPCKMSGRLLPSRARRNPAHTPGGKAERASEWAKGKRYIVTYPKSAPSVYCPLYAKTKAGAVRLRGSSYPDGTHIDRMQAPKPSSKNPHKKKKTAVKKRKTTTKKKKSATKRKKTAVKRRK